MRKLSISPIATLALAGTAALAVVSYGTSPVETRHVVGAGDCGRFTQPDVAVSPGPDPTYDPERGEPVETSTLIDDRDFDSMLEEVTQARTAQINAARFSYDQARRLESAAPTGVPYSVTISFNRILSLEDAMAVAADAGLTVTTVSHAYAGPSDVHVGEIPAVDPAGEPRPISEIAREYIANVRTILGELEGRFGTGDPPHPVMVDAARRVDDAIEQGIGVIGLIATGPFQAIEALGATTHDFIFGVVLKGCLPLMAIVPASMVPFIATHSMDSASGYVGPVSLSPRPEGRS